jgi:hypothetical protein
MPRKKSTDDDPEDVAVEEEAAAKEEELPEPPAFPAEEAEVKPKVTLFAEEVRALLDNDQASERTKLLQLRELVDKAEGKSTGNDPAGPDNVELNT